MGAYGDINRIEIFPQTAQRDVILPIPDIRIRMYLHAGGQNGFDVLVQPFSRETVIRNPVTQHAAQLALLFKHYRMVAH